MSQFRQPPDIDDLSDISWQRVERDLFARLDLDQQPEPTVSRPARRWRWAAAGAGAAVAAAALVLVLHRADSERSPKLSRLVTEGAPSSITVGDTAITAAPHTALLVTESESAGIQVILERGAVDCTVPPRKSRPPFVVVAGDVRVSVTGTRFSVARYGDSAEVVVSRGEVQILAAGERYSVGAGERWPEKAAGAGDQPELYLEDDLSTPRAKKPRHKVKRPVKRPEPEETRPSPKERFATAARLERSDPAAALAIYRQLVRERAGVWSANALYAQAELELRRGNTSRAKKLLERYLKQYPRGPNAAIARSELERLNP